MLLNYISCVVNENRDSWRISSSKSLRYSVGYLEHLGHGRGAAVIISTPFQKHESGSYGARNGHFLCKEMIYILHLTKYIVYLQ